jgi:hypothetical protein
MHQVTPRISAGITRKLSRIVTRGDLATSYLVRNEKPCTVKKRILDEYSPGTLVHSFDFRNGKTLGHYFNSRDIYSLADVVVEPRQGLIYDLDGSLIAESTVWPLRQLFNSFPWRPRGVYDTLDIGECFLIPSSAYGHWIAEDLGSIVHLVIKFPNAKILVSRFAPKYVRDFLAVLDRDYIEIDGPIRVKNLIFVSKSQDSGWMHPRDVEEIRNFPCFKDALTSSQTVTAIYASRRNTKRSPKNEKQIEAEFKQYGFEVIALDELNFLEEIKLLGRTKCLAGVHGSAQVNSVFMPNKTKLLDIVNENYWTELAQRIVQIRDQSYSYLLFPGSPEDAVDLNLIRKEILKLINQ